MSVRIAMAAIALAACGIGIVVGVLWLLETPVRALLQSLFGEGL